jgi:hypothetical protein
MGLDSGVHRGQEFVGRGHVATDAPGIVPGLAEAGGGRLARFGPSTGQYESRPVGRHCGSHP